MGQVARGARHQDGRSFLLGADSSSQPARHTAFSCLSIMPKKSQGQKGLDGVITSLNMAIGALDRAKEATNATPAKAAFTSAGILLTMIKVGFLPVHVSRLPTDVCRARWPTNVELGLTCSDVCEVLNRGIDRKRADQLSRHVLEAIEKLTT